MVGVSAMKHLKSTILSALPLLASLSTGCTVGLDEAPADEEQRTYTLCGDEMTQREMADFVNGNLVILARYSEDGQSKSDAITSLVVSMVLNGIDFSNLGSARPSFEDGHYALQTGDSELGFELIAAGDFADVAAGEIIPHNVFAVDSYARNIHANVDASTFPPTVSVTYEPGPLAELVDGEIEVDAQSLDVSLRVRADLLDIQLDASTVYESVWVQEDALAIQMTTTQVNLADLAGDLEDAGFGFSYDGTAYDSPREEMTQEFSDSEFLTLRKDSGNYKWEGTYRSTVTKAALQMHQSGFVSNDGGNFTEYYCDGELTQFAGVAEHHDSLRGGWFVFPNGERFAYGII